MRLHFRITGLSDRDIEVERRGNAARPSVPAAKLLLWTAIAGAVVYSVGTLAPERKVEAILASKLLVITDTSGSMRGTEFLLNKQLEHLGNAGVSLRRGTALGFGVSVTGWNENFLHQLQQALAANQELDAVYLFSDFTYMDEPIDGSDGAGYEELNQILSRRGLRLYLGTVRDQPPPMLVESAAQSGGGVITSE
ncbi:MAG: hypothetical protein ACREQP_14550 [Candidatus Binatia bacterium]